MIPASFDYACPKTVAEAVSLLGQNPEAKILAGGHSLIPMMRFRLATPAMLVDINQLEGLSYIKEEGDWLEIGAMTRESELDRSELVRKSYSLLADTTRVIADPLVRNLATVGGNIAHADPANDHPATMLAYGAEVTATGPSGERSIPIGDFFLDAFTTSLSHDEILTAIRIPRAVEKSGGAYSSSSAKSAITRPRRSRRSSCSTVTARSPVPVSGSRMWGSPPSRRRPPKMRSPVKSWTMLRSKKRLDWLRKPRSPSRIIAARRSTSVTSYGLLRRGRFERPKSVRQEVACEHPLDHFEGQRRGPYARSRSPHAARPSHPGRASSSPEPISAATRRPAALARSC